MSPPINLGRVRAFQTGDNQDWTPLDCLEYLCEEIRAGHIAPDSLLVHYTTRQPGGIDLHQEMSAKLTHTEYIAFLNLALKKAIDEWQV